MSLPSNWAESGITDRLKCVGVYLIIVQAGRDGSTEGGGLSILGALAGNSLPVPGPAACRCHSEPRIPGTCPEKGIPITIPASTTCESAYMAVRVTINREFTARLLQFHAGFLTIGQDLAPILSTGTSCSLVELVEKRRLSACCFEVEKIAEGHQAKVTEM